MNQIADFFLDKLATTKSLKDAAAYLHALATNSSFGPYQDDFPAMIERLHDIAYTGLNKHLATEGHAPYYIATGIEANLMYSLYEITPGYKYTPRWAMAELDYFATEMYDADDNPATELDYATEILDDCFRRFPGLTQKDDIIVIVLPDIDMEGLAEHAVNNDCTQTMYINARHSLKNLLEDFTYEALALLAAEKEVPPDAMCLMRQTTAPRETTIEDQNWGDYKESLKLGLVYAGPYRDRVSCISDRQDHARAWAKYLSLKFGKKD